MIKSFETGSNPVRCAKFVQRKQWLVAGTDDMKMRVFNYNTMDKVKEWDAHNDYIRFIEVHPNRPLILSSSDDMSIKMWDWEKDFECTQIFEGHSHYVMMVRINPRDTNTFASASLDKSIKIWGLTAGTAHFALEGHDKGVNCLDYYPGGDKPYLLSGADDRTVKIWDYQTKACLQTLEGHTHNVSAVVFHPRLPLILSASEDGTVRLWHATTYRPETTLNYGLERAWAIAVTKESNKIAIGYDEGTIVLKLGNERPVASLDTNTGKLVWAQNHDIQTASLKGIGRAVDGAPELVDGERVTVSARDLGACEVYPQNLQHNSNGSFIVVVGDGEYIIYTSQALRNKSFGSALDFVWSANGTGDYAIRESISRVRTFKNFKDAKQVTLPMASADGLFGGALLGVKGPDCVVFFDWDEALFVRKIDVSPIALYWNEAGDSLVIAAADSFYVLKYDKEAVATALATGGSAISSEEGVAGAFDLVATISEKVQTGQWVGECFLFTSGNRKLNYVVGGEVMTLAHLNQSLYLLGFVPKEDRVFLIDKTYNLYSYKLLLSVLSYQTAVVRKDFVTANSLLPLIPQSEYASVARFLESQGFKEEALAVTTDPDQKFELAVELKRIDIAHEVLLADDQANVTQAEDSTDTQSKWRRLGDLALLNGDLALAELCAKRSGDLSGLLLLHSSAGNREGMLKLGVDAKNAGRLNVAFLSYFLTGRVEECLDLLVEANRVPEATFMARTYLPSHVPRLLALWKQELKGTNEKAAEALADPTAYANLFPDWDVAMQVEQMFLQARERPVPAELYPQAKADLDLDLISLVKGRLAAREKERQPQPEPEEEGEEEVQVSKPTAVIDASEEPAEEGKDVEEEEVQAKTVSAPVSPVRPSAAPVALPSPQKVVEEVKPPVAPAAAVSAPVTPVKQVEAELDDEDLDALLAEEDALVAATSTASAPASSNASPAKPTTSTPAAAAEVDLLEAEDGEDW